MLKKFSFLILVLFAVNLSVFSIDMGKLKTVEVVSAKPAQSAQDSSAQVTVITSDDVEKLHPESTSELLKTVNSVSFNSNGALGSLQTAEIRGSGSRRTNVYLDGSPLIYSHDGTFDISAIPVSIIDRIEIITSGFGKKGQNVAVGGIINIVTKKASDKPEMYVEFENGSFLPLAGNWASLFDSQTVNTGYSFRKNGHGIVLNAGYQRASNNYVYKTNANDSWSIRDNAGMWAAFVSLNADGKAGDFQYSSNNLFRFMHLRVPGSVSWPIPDDYQKTLILSTANTVKKDNFNIAFGYSYNPFEYFSSSYSKHNKHKLYLNGSADYYITDTVSSSVFANINFDMDKSTSLGSDVIKRFNPVLGCSFDFSLGNIEILPMVQAGYASDLKAVVPSASVGLEYVLLNNLTLTANASYAKNLPAFSDMYWPYEDYGEWGSYKGNPDLKPEKALSADFGISYASDNLNYSGCAFVKKIDDMIAMDCDADSNMTMKNISKTFFWGFDQTARFDFGNFYGSLGWLYNRSYDISDGRTIKDNVPVENVRKNTVTLTAGYKVGDFVLSADAKYLGSYYTGSYGVYETKDGVFLVNGGVDWNVNSKLKLYIKIDNIFNVQYQFSEGYPMPGTKIRTGGHVSVL